MAWPSLSARTKTWGTEILTASDLQTQYDLLHTYFNDSLNGTTGHGHTGGTNDGPKLALTTGITGVLPVANGGTNLASYAIGDVLYASASTTIAKLSPSSAGQALTSAGATTAPVFAGMTTQGDIEYFDGTTRQRLAAGTAGQVLKTGGAAANPSWINSLSSVADYGTSSSASTARQGTALKVCYGVATQSGGQFTITNLPFTSGTSYSVITNREATNTGAYQSQAIEISSKTASSFVAFDNLNGTKTVSWIAIGT